MCYSVSLQCVPPKGSTLAKHYKFRILATASFPPMRFARMDDWENLDPDPAFDKTEREQDAPEPESTSAPEPAESETAAPQDDPDAPVCRICFSGADEVDLGVRSLPIQLIKLLTAPLTAPHQPLPMQGHRGESPCRMPGSLAARFTRAYELVPMRSVQVPVPYPAKSHRRAGREHVSALHLRI